MAKKVVEEPKTKKVTFHKVFEGNFNGFPIKMDKYKLKDSPSLELPLEVYEWIQKFKVCK